MAWLFWREIAAELVPGQPPPFTIDLADEAQLRAPRIRWTVLRATSQGEKRIGKARTWVTYRSDDNTFEMHIEIEDLVLSSGLFTVRVPQLASMYRVDCDGRLQEITGRGRATLAVPLLTSPVELKGQLTGAVRQGRFWPRCQVEAPAFGRLEPEMKSVEVSAHGSVLNPLHPVNRIAGLRPGQRWRMPRVDPLAESVVATAVDYLKIPALDPGPRSLDAQVLPQARSLLWRNREVPCLVIEYRSNDLAGCTWVRHSDGLVLRHEAASLGDRVILQRE
jgi:hypothetical protein